MLQYLEKHSSTSYVTAVFTLVSGHPRLEINILYHCTLQYCIINYVNHSHLYRMHACDSVGQTCELTCVFGHANTHSHI